MDFTADWKPLWPISSTFSPPLLISSDTSMGPLLFSPNPATPPTPLLHSAALSPRLPPPYPDLSLPRFLQNYNSIPSSAASISSLLGNQLPDYSSYFHGFNALQLLRIPDQDFVIVFFPAGDNSDQVGFCLLSVKDGILSVGSRNGNSDSFQLAKEGGIRRQRITRLLVNPFDEFCIDDGVGNVRSNLNKFSKNVSVIAFLMVCTEFSVYWYRVGVSNLSKQSDISVCLDYVGCVDAKMLKGSSVVSASWSPHLGEECLVLLQNGDILLFDVNCSGEKRGKLMPLFSGANRVVRKRMQVSLNDKVGLRKEEDGDEGGWFGCEFTWHPRIIIVSHRSMVLLVDLRSSTECKVSCLLKLETLSMTKNDGFMALSRAGSDGFYFSVATRGLLLLCDVRKPLMPVLRWAHDFQNPRYMYVYRLSDLRANAEDNKYRWASDSGYCILLGSFWDGEFSLFCYGPTCNEDGSVSSEISKFCSSFYAWERPSKLFLSSCDCNCGSCLLTEEFSKDSLPLWLDWRQKKDLVLGFVILDADLSARLSTREGAGGFTLMRLTSSGKLEAQLFNATWKSDTFSEVAHKRKRNSCEDNNLYDRNDSGYDGEKKFQHLKFDYLNAYLKDDLASYIVERLEKRTKSDEDFPENNNKVKSKSDFHNEICQKLKAFGFPKIRSSLTVSDVLKDISLPTSIHEVALRTTWAALPTNMLQLGFSTYTDFLDNSECVEPLEFLTIPEQVQVPPFPFRKPSCRSSKWSSKVKPYDSLVGPILPPLFLNTLHNLRLEDRKLKKELYREETVAFSTHFQMKCRCDEVMEVIDEHVSGSGTKTVDDDFVSLADDTDEISCGAQNIKFSYHKPLAFLENPAMKKSGYENKPFSNLVYRSQEPAPGLTGELVGEELFDAGCPIQLKFDKLDGSCFTLDFGGKEMEAYQFLKKQDLDFQKSFKPYQDYIGGNKPK